MTRQAFTSQDAPAPGGPYSHAIEANGFYFTAGFGPHHPQTGEIPTSVADQTHQVMKSLEAVLHARGLTLGEVVKTTVHLSSLEHFEEFNEVYATYFNDPYPARTTVGSELNGFDVEIDVVAVVPQNQTE
ncbi:MAG TPA: Rid family detoxifying hydrolase [Beutenbergiaceae bacterium]|nr:Rid family detoxifying hydrolase [Beutenbergiaceae bacterium]